jgi:hypothetical protein
VGFAPPQLPVLLTPQADSDTRAGKGAPSSVANLAGEQQALDNRALSACIARSSFNQSRVCLRAWAAPT